MTQPPTYELTPAEIRRERLAIRAEKDELPTDPKGLEMIPSDCPRFQTCNAPVCPLDSIPTVHLGGEPVCFYLRASGKAGSLERFGGDPVFLACRERLPEITEAHPDIGRRVAAAAKSGFRVSNLPVKAASEATVREVTASA